jgi:2-methylcitrate dehydratase
VWTARYHAAGADQSYGGRVVITMADGSEIVDEISVADAHPGGVRPFGRDQYVEKFRSLAVPVVGEEEAERFMALALRLPELGPKEVRELTFAALPGVLPPAGRAGIF